MLITGMYKWACTSKLPKNFVNTLLINTTANAILVFRAELIQLLRDNYFISGMQLAKKMSIDLDRVELSKKKFKKTNFDNII